MMGGGWIKASVRPVVWVGWVGKFQIRFGLKCHETSCEDLIAFLA